MVFIDIEDPVQQEKIDQNYVKNIWEIQQGRENQKVYDTQERQDLEKSI